LGAVLENPLNKPRYYKTKISKTPVLEKSSLLITHILC
jgi:hypothetical protein